MIIKGINELEKVIKEIDIDNLNNTVILLNGDLGAGKTTFSKYLLKKIGVTDNVTSPTFNIVNQYDNGKISINHIDAYRLQKHCPEEEMIEELLNDSFSIIEWPQQIKLNLKNYKVININIKIIDEESREFIIC